MAAVLVVVVVVVLLVVPKKPQAFKNLLQRRRPFALPRPDWSR